MEEKKEKRKNNTIKTLVQKMEEVTTPGIAMFIRWYYTPEDERKPWEEFKTSQGQLAGCKSYEQACSWLTREDAQKAVQVYHKHMKLYNMSKLYDSMMKKALDGDTKAATWVQNFVESDYFDDSTDEINDFLDGVNIPSLMK